MEELYTRISKYTKHVLYQYMQDHDISLLNYNFNDYQTSLIKKIEQSVSKRGFVTSQEYPELLNQEIWKTIKIYFDNLRVWLIYDRGKSIAYVWDKNKLTGKEAKQKATINVR